MLEESDSISYTVLDDGIIWVRTETIVSRDGVEIARTNPLRYTISPGENYGTLPDAPQRLCALVHSPEVVVAFNKKMALLLRDE